MSVWDDLIVGPLGAVVDGLQTLDDGLSASHRLDALGAHVAQEVGGGGSARDTSPALTPDDLVIINAVERSVADGIALLDWFDSVQLSGRFEQKFRLERTFNRPGESFGFFGTADLPSKGRTRVMGSTQTMFYDAPRVPTGVRAEAAEWMREQMREFVLRYFMRVSDFRTPAPYIDEPKVRPLPGLSRFSWCERDDIVEQGFGFTQVYYKTRGGDVGKFTVDNQKAIVDLREIGTAYDWIVAKVRIFDFDARVRPFGDDGPELVFSLNEESYIVVAPAFVIDTTPSDGGTASYGLGYAFIRNPGRGLIAYGPGQFDAAVQLIRFDVAETGETHVDMLFLANRPTEVVNVVLDPIDWTFRLGDTLFLGLPSQLFAPVKKALAALPLRFGSFDPVYVYVALAQAVTFGLAGSRLCITREQVDKRFLLQHFDQHYAAILGTLLTWHEIPDWLDTSALPQSVVTGAS
jgi:hypothetical protein